MTRPLLGINELILCTFRRDDLAVDDAVAEVRACRHGRLARGAAGSCEADVPERGEFMSFHIFYEEHGAGARPRHLALMYSLCGIKILQSSHWLTQCIAWLRSSPRVTILLLAIAFFRNLSTRTQSPSPRKKLEHPLPHREIRGNRSARGPRGGGPVGILGRVRLQPRGGRAARRPSSKQSRLGKENLLQGTRDRDHAFTEKTGAASGSVCMGLSASPRSSMGMYSARMPRTWSRIWRCVRFQ